MKVSISMKILKNNCTFEQAIYHVCTGSRVALPEWEKDKLYLMFDNRGKEYVFRMSGKRAQKDLSIFDINSHDWIILR